MPDKPDGLHSCLSPAFQHILDPFIFRCLYTFNSTCQRLTNHSVFTVRKLPEFVRSLPKRCKKFLLKSSRSEKRVRCVKGITYSCLAFIRELGACSPCNQYVHQ